MLTYDYTKDLLNLQGVDSQAKGGCINLQPPLKKFHYFFDPYY